MTRPPALVLTAGLGTRLRPLTDVRAKAAVPVNGTPLARRVARWLAARDVRDQVFNLHHRPDTVAACLGDGSDLGVRVRYSWEDPVLGSAGGPRHALPLLTDTGHSRFLIVNGDTLTNVDLEALLDRHARSGALVTMALIPNPRPEKYGGVAVTPDGFVSGFTRPSAAITSHHFIGVQAAEAAAFAALPDNLPHDSVNVLYPALIRQAPRSVAAFVSDASFHDIGTPADCLATSLALAAHEGDHLVSPHAHIHPSARLERTIVWDDVTVGAGVRLTGCIVADGVRIESGRSFSGCAIVPRGARMPDPDDTAVDALLVRRIDD